MNAEAKLKIPEFRLTEDVAKRAGVIDRAALFMGEVLPMDKTWLVSISEETERRRKLQSDLMWVWHRQYGDYNKHSAKWSHCLIKHEILLPIKLSAESRRVREEAQLEKEILDYVTDYETMIKACFRVIDSHNQPLKLFAHFLTEYQQHASEQGLVLQSNRHQYDEAIYGKVAA